MNLCRDRQIRWYLFFLLFLSVLILAGGIFGPVIWRDAGKAGYLDYQAKIVSSLLEQGVPRTAIAEAVFSSEITPQGRELLSTLGIQKETQDSLLPGFWQYGKTSGTLAVLGAFAVVFVLLGGTVLFLLSRRRLYLQAEHVICRYIEGDCSLHLPQNREGDIYRVFYSVEQLATMLQSKSETEHKTKEFLKDTISDISHQLKTPLSALMMYQEIIENEPDHTETVREFSKKTGTALRRMERLIQSMLKITRLDAGNIVFDQHEYPVAELVERSVSELMTRAHQEKKVLQIQGNPDRTLFCDLEWTSEAVENIVKNALDHTKPGGHITISWEHTPTMVQIQIEDDGNGIPPEDIHHIFKRFYRSSRTISAPGIGLGLPLAKSIVEGQNGQIAVQSTAGMGTVFTLSFLTKL